MKEEEQEGEKWKAKAEKRGLKGGIRVNKGERRRKERKG